MNLKLVLDKKRIHRLNAKDDAKCMKSANITFGRQIVYAFCIQNVTITRKCLTLEQALKKQVKAIKFKT